MMEVLGNAGDKQGLELSQGLRSEDMKTEFLAPALLTYVLQTSLLILFGSGKPFFGAAGAQMCSSASL